MVRKTELCFQPSWHFVLELTLEKSVGIRQNYLLISPLLYPPVRVNLSPEAVVLIGRGFGFLDAVVNIEVLTDEHCRVKDEIKPIARATLAFRVTLRLSRVRDRLVGYEVEM